MNAPALPRPHPEFVETPTLAALTDYVGAHQQAVYTFCYWALGEAGRAQTMTQHVFAQAWPRASAPAIDDETVRLLRIAYQCCKRALRHNHAPAQPDQWDGFGALAMVPAESRCLLILHFYCGLTAEEIALVTDLSPVDVKQRLFQVRRALAAMMFSTDSAKFNGDFSV